MAITSNLKDPITGEILYPVSKTNLIFDDNNKNVNELLLEKVPISRKVNNKLLSEDITLTASDVGAVAANSSITSNTSYCRFPKWDSKGLITGSYATAIAKTTLVNGSSVGTLFGSTSTPLAFYAPTSAGTSGQLLRSNGSGAPTWETITYITSAVVDGPVLTLTYSDGNVVTFERSSTVAVIENAAIEVYDSKEAALEASLADPNKICLY